MPKGIYKRPQRKTHCRRGHEYSENQWVSKDGTKRRCRLCDRIRQSEYMERHGDRIREQRKVSDSKPERKIYKKARNILIKYGLSLEELRSMYEEQGGKCKICSKDISWTWKRTESTEGRMVVDHCHSTGSVRSLLCDRCNRVIGHLNEDPALLRSMIEYLEYYNHTPHKYL